jgi:hypothetical protein
MLLKLMMAFADHSGRTVLKARVSRWHKSEGDWVDYGEDLLDLDVEQIGVPAILTALKLKLTHLNKSPEGVAQLARQILEGRDPMQEHELNGDPFEVRPRDWCFPMRLTSSDAGVLRRTYVKEGEYCEVGDLLAVLTMAEDDPLDESEESLTGASTFRVMENFFPAAEQNYGN